MREHGQHGHGRTGRRHGSRTGRAHWWTAAVAGVAAVCTVPVLAAGPSWADRSGPRPDAQPAPKRPAAVPSRSDLEVIRLDPDAAPPGGTTTVHAFVANQGPDTTASPFTVTVTLPDGVTPEPPYFPEDCTAVGHQVRCVFGPGLKEGRSATALVPVRLSRDLPPGTLTGGSVAVRSADDRNGRNDREPFAVRVADPAAGS
ncbi:hypothetical protein ACGF07_30045 [Kitasatospora sp. NPDC048194]|uniref:hypothetical protein n=1 Tax=Kitasatospora sp. NPDC048194 TaxID=3364045 RepID=UPI00370FB751